MTRQSYQSGHVSEIRTRRGTAYKVRYRVRTAEGKWKQKSETLYDLKGRKAAQVELDQRIQAATPMRLEASELTLRDFVDAYWKPSLDRKCLKLSTRQTYDSALECHIMPALGEYESRTLLRCMSRGLHKPSQRAVCPAKPFAICSWSFRASSRRQWTTTWFSSRRFAKVTNRSTDEKKSLFGRRKWYGRSFRLHPLTPRVLLLCRVNWPEARRIAWFAVETHRPNESETSNRTKSLAGENCSTEDNWEHSDNLPRRRAGQSTHGTLQRATHRSPEDFVFCKNDGSPLHPDVLRKDVLYPILDRLGIARSAGVSGFHTFRHSVASILNAQTGNLKLAQKLLGHSTVNMTADVYTHTSAEAERECRARHRTGDLWRSVPSCSQCGEQEQQRSGN